MDHEHPPSANLMDRFRHPVWLLWLALALAGGYYLITRHEQHLAQLVPYLIFLACPLMHLFMHGGHGHHGRHGSERRDDDRPRG